ncbi:MAG: flagellar export chaperone FliS [Planctomycetota bacterium]
MNEARRYLETQVLTAPKEKLLLMLLDGAIRFATQAREKTAAGDRPGASPLYLRAQAIALELSAALDPGLDPALRRNLAGLYMFVYRRLVAANLDGTAAPAEEALAILGKLRGMFGEAVAALRAGASSEEDSARVVRTG